MSVDQTLILLLFKQILWETQLVSKSPKAGPWCQTSAVFPTPMTVNAIVMKTTGDTTPLPTPLCLLSLSLVAVEDPLRSMTSWKKKKERVAPLHPTAKRAKQTKSNRTNPKEMTRINSTTTKSKRPEPYKSHNKRRIKGKERVLSGSAEISKTDLAVALV